MALLIGGLSYIILMFLVVGGSMIMSQNDQPSNKTGTEDWTEADWTLHRWLKGEGPHPSDIKKFEPQTYVSDRVYDGIRPLSEERVEQLKQVYYSENS